MCFWGPNTSKNKVFGSLSIGYIFHKYSSIKTWQTWQPTSSTFGSRQDSLQLLIQIHLSRVYLVDIEWQMEIQLGFFLFDALRLCWLIMIHKYVSRHDCIHFTMLSKQLCDYRLNVYTSPISRRDYIFILCHFIFHYCVVYIINMISSLFDCIIAYIKAYNILHCILWYIHVLPDNSYIWRASL